MGRQKSWTKEEIEILKKNWNLMLKELCDLLPNRDKASIATMRSRIRHNYKVSKGLISSSFWDDQDIDFLKKNYLTMSTIQLAEALHRTERSIHMKLIRLELNSQTDNVSSLMNLTDIERSYIAGFTDGEGYIGGSLKWNEDGSPKKYTPQIVLTNTNAEVMQWLGEKFKHCSKWEKSQKAIDKRYTNWTHQYILGITGQNHILAFCKEIRPFSVVKKNVIDAMINYCERHTQHIYSQADWLLVYEILKSNNVNRSVSIKNLERLKEYIATL